MDIYTEYIVKHTKNMQDIAKIAAIILGAVMLSFACLIFHKYLFGFSFILIALIWYGAYYFCSSQNIEYEYILTNHELDIDKIIARRGRKRMVTINFKEVELCANINNPDFKREYQNTLTIAQTSSFIGDDKSGQIYFVDFHKDGAKKRVLFEPNQRILDEIKKINPRNIHV